MNTEHKDIRKIIPFGEYLRGFVNQRYITEAELNRVLKERGVFVLNPQREFIVPLLQTLLLSPSEFDKIREAFSTREDNRKVNSSDINWEKNASIFVPDLMSVDVSSFIKTNLPTCTLEQPIRFTPVESNKNHLKASFTIKRNDRNKSWYEQTNIFDATIEIIKDKNGKGRIIVSHTAPETKELAEFIVKQQVKKYKNENIVAQKEKPRKILFEDFTNEERFVFFFRLTSHLDSDYFNCNDIKDLSIKPEDEDLPEKIKWMEELNKILLSGRSLDKKEFIKDNTFHRYLIIWNIESVYSFEFKGHKGVFTVNFGFSDYIKKERKSEFELNISSFKPEKALDTRAKKRLKYQLLSEMDRQKSAIYNSFLEYKLNEN